MYKCAIVGVGPNRSRGLAEAYRHITRGKLAAVSARSEENRVSFAETYGVDGRFSDYAGMFEREKPDLVHVNTPPTLRLEVMQAAEAAGVKALIVEKPLAVQGEDYREILSFSERTTLKVAINHQLHFQPRRFELQQAVADGKIGDVRFIEASCGMNLAYQGTHALQSIGAFIPDARPVTVFGQVSGAKGLEDTPKKHFSPTNAEASVTFDNDIQALLQSGETAPKLGRETINTHKRVAVYGTRGYVHWTMWSWEIGTDGRVEEGKHEYPDEDILGQAAMTEAMFDWIEDDRVVHPLNLERALVDFNIVLGIFVSSLEHRPVELPFDPPDGIIDRLRKTLS